MSGDLGKIAFVGVCDLTVHDLGRIFVLKRMPAKCHHVEAAPQHPHVSLWTNFLTLGIEHFWWSVVHGGMVFKEVLQVQFIKFIKIIIDISLGLDASKVTYFVSLPHQNDVVGLHIKVRDSKIV